MVVLRSVTGPAALAQSPDPKAAAVQSAPAQLTDAEIATFLREGEIIKTRSAGKGVTNSIRVTMKNGTLVHDAHIQVIDERKATGPNARGTELNFRDSWTFNVAAYKLDRLIGLNLVPVSIERSYRSKSAAYTWWVDDVMMDEKDRLSKKLQPPQPMVWAETMQLVRIFDQLIYNVDRNMGNLLITNDWHIWAIDHTRAFRLHKTISKPENVTRCDRDVLEGLKRLDKASLERELGRYLTTWERDAILARRDQIVSIIEKAGEAGVFVRRQN
jgi:hypothetical protein